MDNTDSTGRLRAHTRNRVAGRSILGIVLLAGVAHGQDQGLRLEADFLIGASRTDNIYLLPDPDAVDETVYQLTPNIMLDYTSNRIEFNGRYQFDYYDYKTLDTDNQLHQYDVSMSNELIEDAFFFDIGGSRTQSVVDPDATIPPGNLQISNNLVDRDDYYLAPRIDKTFAGNVTTLAEYRYEDVSYDDTQTDQALDSINENALFRIDNFERQDGLTFMLSYEWEQSEYDDASVLPWEYEKAAGELGYWISNSFRLFGGGGEESAWDDPIDRSLQDGFWEAGLELLGSGRFRAEFAAGERSFGDSWRGELDVKFRRGDLQFSYEQLPTTTGQDRYSSGLLDPDSPDDILTRPGSAERYISNRGEARLALEFRRSTLNIILFDEDRTGRFLADGTPLPDESQRGGTLNFNFSVGPRTELIGEGSFYNRATESNGDVDYLYGSLTANYQLLSRLTMSVVYEYGGQDPSLDSTALDYESNMISLFFIYSIQR